MFYYHQQTSKDQFLLKIQLKAHSSIFNYHLINFILISKIKLANVLKQNIL